MNTTIKALESLIKIKKKELDEARVLVLEKQFKKNQIIERIFLINSSLEKERKFIEAKPELQESFVRYFAVSKDLMSSLYNNVKQMDEEISVYQSFIHKKFVEFKLFEIAKNQKTRQILEKQQKKLQQNLDEIALNNFMHNVRK